jgi:F-type H+-transporting ATPase subunit delta
VRFETIARNYAQALFDLAEKGRGEAPASAPRTQLYADLLDAVAGGIAAAPKVQAVLLSPRVTKAQKSRLLAEALKDAPAEFVRFLGAVVKRGRQGLFGQMAQEYQALLDIKLNRVRAAVTVARPADEALRKKIAARLTEVVGKQVLPHFIEDPSILGGVVVRVGDRVFDGSIRRRMTMLRRQLLAR